MFRFSMGFPKSQDDMAFLVFSEDLEENDDVHTSCYLERRHLSGKTGTVHYGEVWTFLSDNIVW